MGLFAPANFYHMNQYIVDKAFIYGVIAFSKWMGPELFPFGIYAKWPPVMRQGEAPADGPAASTG